MNLMDQLRRDEGVKLRPYRDSVGKLTIGVGRNLDDVGISPLESDVLLINDITRAQKDIDLALPWTDSLDEARLGVLTNMAFNMGINSLLGFKNFLGAVAAKDYEKAAQEMLQSKWAEEVGPRAHRLSIQMQTGLWT